MKTIEVLAKLVEECGLEPIINERQNHISIHKSPRMWYRIALSSMTATISKHVLKTMNLKGNIAYHPKKTSLFAIDLHNPNSLDALKTWLKHSEDQNDQN